MNSIFRPNPETGGRTLNPKFVLGVVGIFTFISFIFMINFQFRKNSKIEKSEFSSVGSGDTGRAYSKLLKGVHDSEKEKNDKLLEYAESIADPTRGEYSSDLLRNMRNNLPEEEPISNLGDEIFSNNKNSLDSLVVENESALSGYIPFSRRVSTSTSTSKNSRGNSNQLSLISISSEESAVKSFYSKEKEEKQEKQEKQEKEKQEKKDLETIKMVSDISRVEDSVNDKLLSQEKILNDMVLGQEKLLKSIDEKNKELNELKEESSNTDHKITDFSGNSFDSRSKKGISANSVPTGTNIPVVLLQDVVTTNRKQHIWVQVAQEVIFRNQVQLPKGVRIRGNSSGSIREMVDIDFDLMVFPDGTELSLSASAVNGFDPRFPNMYKLKGVTGTYIVPPVWTKLLPIFIEAAIGYTDNNREFRQPTGNSTEGSGNTPAPDEDERINEAINSATTKLGDMVIEDLERYQPYVRLNRGQSFFVQTNSILDFSSRSLGGSGGSGSSVSTVDNLINEVSGDSEFTTELNVPNSDLPIELPNGISNGLKNSIESYLSE